MKNINELINQANISLNDKLLKLDALEKEKMQILEKYKYCKQEEKSLIEVEMKKSEKNFKNLCDEILLLSQKVKNLKNYYC